MRWSAANLPSEVTACNCDDHPSHDMRVDSPAEAIPIGDSS